MAHNAENTAQRRAWRDAQGKRLYHYDAQPPRHQGVASRCSGCGGMVQKPCMVCEMRNETHERDGNAASEGGG